MRKVQISENITGIVEARKVINKISTIEKRLNSSENRANNLLSNIKSSNQSIQSVINGDKGRNWYTFYSIDKKALLDLIRECNIATHTTVSSISELLRNNNENVKDLSEMIGALAMLSGLSFEKISETTAELEAIIDQVNESSTGTNVQGKHINRIIVSQIDKIKEEKKRSDRIDYNFGVINENLNEIKEQVQGLKSEFRKNNNKIKTLIDETPEDHFIKRSKRQDKKIQFLSISLVINFTVTLGVILYNIIS